MTENKKFPQLNPKPNFSSIEQSVLEIWKRDNTFRESVDKKVNEEFVFYDGPPFANDL